jgi:hypothetical protein
MFIPDPFFFFPHQRIFTQENAFYALGNMILIFYPSRVPDSEDKKAPDRGSGSVTLGLEHLEGSKAAVQIINHCSGLSRVFHDG